MATREVIDLSFSTDDENIENCKRPSTTAISVQADSAYGSLSDNFIDIDGGPRKKRKLSPLLSNQNGKHTRDSRTEVADKSPALPDLNKKEQFLTLQDDDPIIWTSSPKQKLSARPAESYSHLQQWASLSESDGDLPDEAWVRTASQKPFQPQKRFGQSVALNSDRNSTRITSVLPRRKDNNRRIRSSSQSSEDDVTSRIRKVRTATKPKLTEEARIARAREKEETLAAAKAAKVKEKEEAKERKRLLKEEQAREKQRERDRAEANKLKLDKKLSTPEMIVDLPIAIDSSTVDTQIRELLKHLSVEVTSYQSPVPNLIRWRRKVESRFNAEKGYREKLARKEIDTEKHIMCLMSATELADLAALGTQDGSQGLDGHVTRVKSAFNDCIIIYMIEGFDVWIRKNRNAHNRAYASAVRDQADIHSEENTTKRSTVSCKRKQQRIETVDEDTMENALLRLQVVHKCLVHHAAAPMETAEWVAHFTEQISQIPYRHEQMARESTFCMESGQVKSGKDAEDTYVNMLLANVRVTNPIAYSIAARYPNVSSLVRGLEEKGPLALEHLKKSANRDGSVTDTNIGQAISRRLYKVFTDLDPSTTDI
ncbi:MAG: hypothetical protein Q9216_003016 [Gyalolechia sp. 2 TL-2023]